MDRNFILRRAVHVSTPLFLVYYFLPSPLWPGGPPKEVGLLMFLVLVLLFEMLRLALGFKVPGMRQYELNQVSAGAWAGIALTITFLFFPLSLAAPALVGMALIDPLISTVRRTRYYPWVPLVAYFVLALATLSLFYPLSLRVVVAGGVASVIAIAAEGIKTSYVDDDFLMIVVPLIGLALVMSF